MSDSTKGGHLRREPKLWYTSLTGVVYLMLDHIVPDLSASGRYLRNIRLKLPRMFVYAWRRGNEYLYIGKTIHGMERLRNHHIVNKVEPRKDNDIIEFWFCGDDLELADLERNLIFILCPKYNTTHKNSSWSANPKNIARMLNMTEEKLCLMIAEAKAKEENIV